MSAVEYGLVEGYRKRKYQLEEDLYKLLSAFEADTTVQIDSIQLVREQHITSRFPHELLGQVRVNANIEL